MEPDEARRKTEELAALERELYYLKLENDQLAAIIAAQQGSPATAPGLLPADVRPCSDTFTIFHEVGAMSAAVFIPGPEPRVQPIRGTDRPQDGSGGRVYLAADITSIGLQERVVAGISEDGAIHYWIDPSDVAEAQFVIRRVVVPIGSYSCRTTLEAFDSWHDIRHDVMNAVLIAYALNRAGRRQIELHFENAKFKLPIDLDRWAAVIEVLERHSYSKSRRRPDRGTSFIGVLSGHPGGHSETMKRSRYRLRMREWLKAGGLCDGDFGVVHPTTTGAAQNASPFAGGFARSDRRTVAIHALERMMVAAGFFWAGRDGDGCEYEHPATDRDDVTGGPTHFPPARCEMAYWPRALPAKRGNPGNEARYCPYCLEQNVQDDLELTKRSATAKRDRRLYSAIKKRRK